ncbi:MAG TPA: flagellar hook-associated protein FlgK [Burkholderiaceae bacterium]|nr:flagellar hook-associated protein FlgK [Burkholderiaceae bacterium]
MSSDLLSVGTTALNAASIQLQTAGNNIANVNTPGYSRETVVQSAAFGTQLGGMYIGQGVQVDTVKREYNDFLTQQANQATATSAAADQHAQDLAQVDNLFKDTTSGVGASMTSFFSAVQTLSQNPSDSASRTAMLSAAQTLAQSFNSANDALQQMQASSTQAITNEVGNVNQLASQIATLNNQIALARGNGGTPNQLLDQRDALVRNLNQSIQVSSVTQSDGSVNLFLGNGQPLVVGATASTLSVGQDPSNPQNVALDLQTQSGAKVPLQSSGITGGKIGAMLQFNLHDIPAVEDQLGRLATTLSDQVNAQQALGQDLNGNAGTNLFSSPSATVIPSNANTGGATVSATFANTSQLQASAYQLEYVNNKYQLTRLSDNTVTTSATMPMTVDGVTLNVAGTPASGDLFTIEPVRNGAGAIGVTMSDPSLIAAASPVSATLGASNKGSVAITSLAAVGPTRNANIAQPVTINFTSATTYTTTSGGVTSASQNYVAGTPIAVNGWSMVTSGTPSAGDSIAVSATGAQASDGNNAVALANLQNQSLVSGSPLATGYAALVADVGGMAQTANTVQTSQQQVLSSATSAEASVSGVNLDEEATKLIQYQQQYQAAAKVISTASTLFNTILNLGN